MSLSKPRIIVTGYVGYIPVGGVAWDYLQYPIGLARLGYDVFYHEDTLEWPYDPLKQERTLDAEYSAQYIEKFFEHYAPELSNRWHYLHVGKESFGMSRSRFTEIARTADLFLNISGASFIPEELSPNCVKVFIDTDPGYNQIRMAQKMAQTSKMPGFLTAHDQYFSYAENINSEDCLLPTFEVHWKTTRMPIVLDLWEPFGNELPSKREPWTTVLTWSEFKGKLVYNGVEYEGKGVEFEKIMELPQRVDFSFEIAVGGNTTPVERLTQNGWKVLHGPDVTRTPQKYQQFIAKSRGEISVAKNVYVALRTGWFSCRSACYLATGRPTVLQNTGFDKVFPTDKGIKVFDNLNEAVSSIREIESNYEVHAKAAHEIAEEYFDSKKVLSRLVKDALEGTGSNSVH